MLEFGFVRNLFTDVLFLTKSSCCAKALLILGGFPFSSSKLLPYDLSLKMNSVKRFLNESCEILFDSITGALTLS